MNWFPIQVVHAKQKIIDGAIGEPYFAQANYWESVGTYELLLLFYKYYCIIYKSINRGGDFHNGKMPEWKLNPDQVGGGTLMDGLIHWIRSLRIL